MKTLLLIFVCFLIYLGYLWWEASQPETIYSPDYQKMVDDMGDRNNY